MLISAYLFFPTSPAQLTLISEKKAYFHRTCPLLVDTKADKLNPQQPFLPSSFTLLNWNIYKQQKENWQPALQSWSKQADIITLQEAKYSLALRQLSQQAHLHTLQNVAFKHNGDFYGVNTLSSVGPSSICGTTDKEPWIRVSKSALATTYPMQGFEKKLLVINLHAINFTFTAKPLQHQLRPYLTLLAQHTGPAILSGDFNTWSDKRLMAIEQPLQALGFSEVKFEPDHRLTRFNLPLDHIYFRGLTVIKAQSLTTTASDHTPQLVTFKTTES